MGGRCSRTYGSTGHSGDTRRPWAARKYRAYRPCFYCAGAYGSAGSYGSYRGFIYSSWAYRPAGSYGSNGCYAGTT